MSYFNSSFKITPIYLFIFKSINLKNFFKKELEFILTKPSWLVSLKLSKFNKINKKYLNETANLCNHFQNIIHMQLNIRVIKSTEKITFRLINSGLVLDIYLSIYGLTLYFKYPGFLKNQNGHFNTNSDESKNFVFFIFYFYLVSMYNTFSIF